MISPTLHPMLSHYHISNEVKIISNPRPLAWKASTCHPDYQVYFQGAFASFEITIRFCVKKHWEELRFSQNGCWCRVRTSSPSRNFSSWIARPWRHRHYSLPSHLPFGTALLSRKALIIMKVSLYPLATVGIINMTAQSMLDTSCKSVGRSCTQSAVNTCHSLSVKVKVNFMLKGSESIRLCWRQYKRHRLHNCVVY
jgi:hypothetical protein